MAKSHSSPAGRLTPAKRRAAPEPPPEDDEEIDELEHGAALGDYDEHAMHAHYGGEDDDGLEIESPQAEEPVQRLGPAPPDGAVVKRPRGRPRKDNSAKPRRDPLAPKRPGSAYTLFVHDRYPEVKARLAVENAAAAAAAAEAAATGADPGEVSKTTVIAEVGRMWKALPPEERRPYEDRAAAEKLHYDAAVRHYVESGAKQRWLAANPRPAGAAGSAGGTPVPRAAALPQIQMVAHAGHLQQVLVPPGYATAVQAVVVPKEEPGAGPAPLSPQTEHIVALLHRFGEQDDLEGLDEIENAIETLEGPSRDEAKRHLTALLKIKSKMMVEGWVAAPCSARASSLTDRHPRAVQPREALCRRLTLHVAAPRARPHRHGAAPARPDPRRGRRGRPGGRRRDAGQVQPAAQGRRRARGAGDV
ncbi:hypothetical protein DFJ74DRAFT_3334 [Hyaloraphidium curvatum]|nr:hypothetical protein DFJ74DRAFT_3334 [Hyaloraphidium curvatum]